MSRGLFAAAAAAAAATKQRAPALIAACLVACYAADADSPSLNAPGGSPVKVVAVGPGLALAPSSSIDTSVTGSIQAVADSGEQVVVFGERGAVALAGTDVSARATGVSEWRSAASVLGPDKGGRWGVAVSADGKVMHLHEQGRLEEVGTRYGLERNDRAVAVLEMSDTSFAVLLETAAVVVDVTQGTSRRFDGSAALRGASASSTRIAGIDGDKVVVLDVGANRRVVQTIAGAHSTAFDDTGRLLIATEHAILREDGADLAVIVERTDQPLRGLASAGARVWFAVGGELWAVEHDAVRRGTTTIGVTDRLFGARGGDVWTLGDKLTRLRVEVSPEELEWQRTIAPIYERTCKECHSAIASSSSKVDLSTFVGWNVRKEAIIERVLTNRTMPPPPRTVSDSELGAIRAFVGK